MRRLREWKDAQGNKVSPNTSSGTSTPKNVVKNNSTTSQDHSDKFKKLIEYHKAHRKLTPIKEYANIKPDTLYYSESCITSGEERNRNIYIRFNFPEEGQCVLNVDLLRHASLKRHTLCDKTFEGGWEELMTEIKTFLSTPPEGTPDYQELVESINTRTKEPARSTGSVADDFKLYENLWD